MSDFLRRECPSLRLGRKFGRRDQLRRSRVEMNDAARFQVLKEGANNSEFSVNGCGLAPLMGAQVVAVTNYVCGRRVGRVNTSNELEEVPDGACIGRARLLRDRFIDEGASQLQ